jgi:hypothetical protein
MTTTSPIRSTVAAAVLVEAWQQDDIYPYQGHPGNAIEEAERQVFNIAALAVHNCLPHFQEADEPSRRLQFRLLRQLVERAPADLARILSDVLDLPPQRRQELSGLLDRTSLSHIAASKGVSERLEFLQTLEKLVFDADFPDRVRERSQLHRVLAEHAWVFGEQYHLSVHDPSLTEVLKEHFTHAGQEVQIDGEVGGAEGSAAARSADLMFSRTVPLAGAECEHLVAVLKRPDTTLDAAAARQIENCAFAVAADERFLKVPVQWVVWVVATEVDALVARLVRQANRAPGILFRSGVESELQVTLWVKTWRQIINECRGRMRFFAQELSAARYRDLARLGRL